MRWRSRMAKGRLSLLVLAAVVGTVLCCQPPDCDTPDCGSCSNACCLIEFMFEANPDDVYMMVVQSLKNGGADMRYTFVNGTDYRSDNFSAGVKYQLQAIHSTMVHHYNDTLDMLVVSKNPAMTTLRGRASSQEMAALLSRRIMGYCGRKKGCFSACAKLRGMAVVSQYKVSLGGEGRGGWVCVDKVPDDTDVCKYIQSKCSASGRDDVEDPFMVVDIGRLFVLHTEWKSALPRVQPFYAVKVNEDRVLLKTLAAMGTGFDCASKHEIQAVLDLGVSPDSIIYANPCKHISHLTYAAKKGVELITFDNEWELHKVKKHFPEAKLVIRICADDIDAKYRLGSKYGCSVAMGKALLNTALSLDLQVVGVCFHVGSGCQTPLAYQSALELSSELFQYAASIGYHFTLLDMGGGFPGDKGSNPLFREIAAAINNGLDAYFSEEQFPDVKIVAEPGTYFACSTHSIAVNVIAKRLHQEEGEEDYSYMYYVSDGIYGSLQFYSIHYEDVRTPIVLKSTPTNSPRYNTILWGPTLDSRDKICEVSMPELDIGDWIYFNDVGAYTTSCSTPFNGFPKPTSYHYIKESISERFEALVPTSRCTADSETT